MLRKIPPLKTKLTHFYFLLQKEWVKRPVNTLPQVKISSQSHAFSSLPLCRATHQCRAALWMVTVPRLGHPGAGKSKNTAKSADRVVSGGCRTDCAQDGGERCGWRNSTMCFSTLMAGPVQQPFTEQHEESENPNPSLSLLGCAPDICP